MIEKVNNKLIRFTLLILVYFSSPTAALIGGDEIDIRNVPWHVGVDYKVYDYSGEPIYGDHCGGVIISERWILTAAHCLFRGNEEIREGIYILAGSSVRKTDANVFSFTEITRVIHEDYVNEITTEDKLLNSNDIALIKVDKSLFPIGSPIKIASKDEYDLLNSQNFNTWEYSSYNTSNLIISGWGTGLRDLASDLGPIDIHSAPSVLNRLDSFHYRDNLEVVTMSFIPRFFCGNDLFSCSLPNEPNTLKNPCSGDSGGPVVWQNPNRVGDADFGLRLVGLVSSGDECTRAGVWYEKKVINSYNLNVVHFRDWIETTISNVDNERFLLENTDIEFQYDPFLLLNERNDGAIKFTHLNLPEDITINTGAINTGAINSGAINTESIRKSGGIISLVGVFFLIFPLFLRLSYKGRTIIIRD